MKAGYIEKRDKNGEIEYIRIGSKKSYYEFRNGYLVIVEIGKAKSFQRSTKMGFTYFKK